MGADGGGDRELFSALPDGCERMSRPAITPDGQIVVTCVARRSEVTPLLLVTLTAGGAAARQDRSVGRSDRDSRRRLVIYWRNEKDKGDGGSLYVTAIDGSSDPVQLTDGNDGEDADPVCSPDGTQLAFRRLTDDERVVVTAPFDGQQLTEEPTVRSTGENDQDPSWSPDGLRLAYKQGPNRNADLRVVDLDSGASNVVVDNSEPDTAPAWTAR